MSQRSSVSRDGGWLDESEVGGLDEPEVALLEDVSEIEGESGGEGVSSVGDVWLDESEGTGESGREVLCCWGDGTIPFGPRGGSMSNDPSSEELELDVGEGGDVRGGGDPVGTSG